MSSVLSYGILSRSLGTLVGASILGTILALTLSFLQPLQYSSTVRLLITQTTLSATDPYSALKFTERIAGSLSELLYSSTFANNILQSAKALDQSYFPQTEYNKRKLWQKTVEASVVYGTGVLSVAVYDQKPDSAEQLAGAVVDTLAARGWEYVGGDVTIKAINAPVATRFPVRPNLLLNAIAGFVVGALFVCATLLRRRA